MKKPDAHSDELPGDLGPPSLHHGGPQHDHPHRSELGLNWDEQVSGGAGSITQNCSSTMDKIRAYRPAPCHGARPRASPAQQGAPGLQADGGAIDGLS